MRWPPWRRRRFAPQPRPARPARRLKTLSAGSTVAMLALTATLLVALITVAAVMEDRLASAAAPAGTHTTQQNSERAGL